ncbi:MAG: LON peptidase substrate-binding domain-containing protein [Pseudomonadota bacterium]
MQEREIPLFPLHTVLFPGGILPLRIFEPRYLDMVSRCLKTGTGFGVCLISAGTEAGRAASVYPLGTLMTITDWHKREDGLLGITVHGEQRFAVRAQHVESDQLIRATVEMIANEPYVELPEDYAQLAELLRGAFEQINHPYENVAQKLSDASWLSCRLAELLPLNLDLKQELLQMNDPLQRLARIYACLEKPAADH